MIDQTNVKTLIYSHTHTHCWSHKIFNFCENSRLLAYFFRYRNVRCHYTLTAPHINCIKAYAPRSLCVIGNFRLNTAYLYHLLQDDIFKVLRTKCVITMRTSVFVEKKKIQNFSYAAVCFTF